MFKTPSVKAGGVKMFDLEFHSVARRTKSKGTLYIEKINFIKHVDNR